MKAAAKPQSSQVSAVDYLPLVHRVARRLGRRLPPHVSFDDLVGAGVVGLLEALERFDPGRATEFAAYAEFRIKGAILDELRRNDMMARDARSEAKRIEGAMAKLTQEMRRPPTDEELAEALQWDVPTLLSKLERLTPVRLSSFDEQLGHGGGSMGNAFERVSHAQTQQRLVAALRRLNERQQHVLHLYYREELTLKEIGVVLEVSESRVCQIMSAATLQLRALMEMDNLPESPNEGGTEGHNG